MGALSGNLGKGAPPLLRSLAGTLIGGLFALPDSVLRVLGGRAPDHAAQLRPDAWLVARLSAIASLPAGERPVEEMRERFELIAAPFAPDPRLLLASEEHRLPGPAGEIPSRLYVPAGAPRPGPLLVYFHGGGWVQGSIESHDRSCRLLASLAGIRILSVEYRLAPENPFPAAADDALAAYAAAAERHAELGADPARLALGGDSAGGNLAAVAAQAACADPELPSPAFQLLLYPALDMSRRTASRRLFGERFLLTEDNMAWYEDQYVPDPAHRANPRVSPLLAPELSRLPPTCIAVSIADPLLDDGVAYAERLREAGVRVALQRHPLLHGFFNQTVTRGARLALASIAGALRQGLA